VDQTLDRADKVLVDLARCRFVLVAMAPTDARCFNVTYNHKVDVAVIEGMLL